MAGFFKRLTKGKKNNNNTKAKTIGNATDGLLPSWGIGTVMDFYRFGSYDNTYPNITRIAEAMAEVMPYAIDKDGNRLDPQPRWIQVLYNPNKQMSGVDFFETMAVLGLVFPKVYILCWHAEGGRAIAGGRNITAENIAGFTFLENPKVEYDSVSGMKTYTTRSLGEEHRYYEYEVIELSMSVNPYALLEGYSPSMASKKWSNTDDYIADYQGGFFENGAIPSGQFIITASSVEEFNEIVADMQLHHRGAGANNNVQYIHRPVNADTGMPMNAQIEWVPFQQPNNQLALKDIFEQANKKIDMAFGVPQEVKGYLTNSNYASVSVADYVFARRVVYPKLVKMWSKFTHEMNRITGGTGYAISFDYEIPVLEEQRKAQVENLSKILDKGFTLESAVEALQLPKSFLKLSLPDEPEKEEERSDIQDVDMRESADQRITSRKYLGEVKKKIAEANPKVYKIVEDYTQEQVDSAVNQQTFDEKKNAKIFRALLLVALLEIVDESGTEQYAVGKERVENAGYDITATTEFRVPEQLERAYGDYLDGVTLSYTEDTSKAVKSVLEQAQTEGWSEAQTKEALANIMETDKWRIERIARTESHRSVQLGNLQAMRQLQSETGAKIWKVWHLNPMTENHCETCESLDGVRLPLGDSFGDFNVGAGEIADAHPNCSCYLSFEIDSVQKEVKCPKCHRHLFESNGGNMKGIKCQGCKSKFDIEVCNGKVIANEIQKETEDVR